MKTLLVTGFEPFGGVERNASWEAVKRLPDTVAGYQVERLCLPVVYGDSGAMLRDAVRRLHPTLVLCVGVAGGRKQITPEKLAVNYRRAGIADNAGRLYTGEPIVSDGPDGIMTRLPVESMVERLREEGLPAEVSLTAGGYVCNDLYYHALLYQAEDGYQGLFVHVPPEETLSAEESARGLRLCLETALVH